VAEDLLDHAKRYPKIEQQRCAAVPEGMERNSSEACVLPEHLEAPVDVAWLNRCSLAGREDQIRVGPLVGGQPLRYLALPVLLECPDADSWERDRPPGPPGLGAREPQFSIEPLQRIPHTEGRPVQVDRRPTQGEQLAASEPEQKRQHIQREESITASGGQLRPSSETSEVAWILLDDLDGLSIHPSMRMRIDHYLERRQQPYIG